MSIFIFSTASTFSSFFRSATDEMTGCVSSLSTDPETGMNLAGTTRFASHTFRSDVVGAALRRGIAAEADTMFLRFGITMDA